MQTTGKTIKCWKTLLRENIALVRRCFVIVVAVVLLWMLLLLLQLLLSLFCCCCCHCWQLYCHNSSPSFFSSLSPVSQFTLHLRASLACSTLSNNCTATTATAVALCCLLSMKRTVFRSGVMTFDRNFAIFRKFEKFSQECQLWYVVDYLPRSPPSLFLTLSSHRLWQRQQRTK